MRRGGRRHPREITWLDHLVLRGGGQDPREITWVDHLVLGRGESGRLEEAPAGSNVGDGGPGDIAAQGSQRRCPGGVDPTLEGRALQDALRKAIATRRGSCPGTSTMRVG